MRPPVFTCPGFRGLPLSQVVWLSPFTSSTYYVTNSIGTSVWKAFSIEGYSE